MSLYSFILVGIALCTNPAGVFDSGQGSDYFSSPARGFPSMLPPFQPPPFVPNVQSAPGFNFPVNMPFFPQYNECPALLFQARYELETANNKIKEDEVTQAMLAQQGAGYIMKIGQLEQEIMMVRQELANCMSKIPPPFMPNILPSQFMPPQFVPPPIMPNPFIPPPSFGNYNSNIQPHNLFRHTSIIPSGNSNSGIAPPSPNEAHNTPNPKKSSHKKSFPKNSPHKKTPSKISPLNTTGSSDSSKKTLSTLEH